MICSTLQTYSNHLKRLLEVVRLMNIIIVEDTLLVRTMLVALLDGQGDFKVVAAVESVEEALDVMAHNYVNLVILDLCLPGLSYDQAVKAIKTASPDMDI